MSYTGHQSDDGADGAARKRRIAMVVIVALSAVAAPVDFVRADGLPMSSDRQHAGGEYTVLTLTEEQDQEVQRNRLFTPTAEQLALLRKIDPTCPAKLQVVTPWFDDCGCGMHGYVMWFRPGEIDAPHGAISRWERFDGLVIQAEAAEGDTTAINLMQGQGAEVVAADRRIISHASGDLVMDLDGNLYCNGDSIDTAEILSMIDRCNAEHARHVQEDTAERDEYSPWNTPHLWLHMPPLDTQSRHTWLFNALLDLAAELARKGWRLGLVG